MNLENELLENQLLENFQVEELEKRYEMGWSQDSGPESVSYDCGCEGIPVTWYFGGFG